eukprot:CAMPEP_0181294750 /NCGR_PEP_ID=MMETSP1101-20121128/3774_1 /TAXON_ID=46948 /ORGANISM="Rhodomonas abbreviata, Strain Caron Lab Isolate" /LENGTH=109 /DNA_ID=CAMNT_0023399443 /DNA_START=214 /DNA_END=543 /DNA_ORIENTATION=+
MGTCSVLSVQPGRIVGCAAPAAMPPVYGCIAPPPAVPAKACPSGPFVSISCPCPESDAAAVRTMLDATPLSTPWSSAAVARASIMRGSCMCVPAPLGGGELPGVNCWPC